MNTNARSVRKIVFEILKPLSRTHFYDQRWSPKRPKIVSQKKTLGTCMSTRNRIIRTAQTPFTVSVTRVYELSENQIKMYVFFYLNLFLTKTPTTWSSMWLKTASGTNQPDDGV